MGQFFLHSLLHGPGSRDKLADRQTIGTTGLSLLLMGGGLNTVLQ
jgi:hypothetical protein